MVALFSQLFPGFFQKWAHVFILLLTLGVRWVLTSQSVTLNSRSSLATGAVALS